MVDIALVHDSLTAAPAQQIPYPESCGAGREHDRSALELRHGREALPATSCRGRLIDTRLVRAEMARLRGPRPATSVYRARVRTTIPGAA